MHVFDVLSLYYFRHHHHRSAINVTVSDWTLQCQNCVCLALACINLQKNVDWMARKWDTDIHNVFAITIIPKWSREFVHIATGNWFNYTCAFEHFWQARLHVQFNTDCRRNRAFIQKNWGWSSAFFAIQMNWDLYTGTIIIIILPLAQTDCQCNELEIGLWIVSS